MAGGAALAVVGAAMSPVFGAPHAAAERPVRLSARGGIGSFTPAAADPRVAAALARAGLSHSGFRFTPAAIGTGNRSVTVAVRAASNAGRTDGTRTAGTVILTPIAYNLGVAVGWKRFALSGDVARIDTAGMPGSRERVDLGLSYNAPRWSGRIQVERDRPMDPVSKLTGGQSTSFDLGGSYRIARNIDVTAGVRYRAEDRDRLKLVDDRRRDAQAVYIGTAFKF
ncbi:porin [Sphingomonas changnyeongensis]|uniref:Porin n=1 Tax=Sphingomonas changnyeongensis TaxID=2698679 RepID=A0A7Z2NXP8_9SPHN|nr:porin [Sphingomonas changnyeongensis]